MTNEEAANVLRIMATGINLKGYTEHWMSGFKEAYELAIQVLEERPQGEWYYNYQTGWHCSICHESVKDMPTVMGKANFAFCPNCGAKMKGEVEE